MKKLFTHVFVCAVWKAEGRPDGAKAGVDSQPASRRAPQNWVKVPSDLGASNGLDTCSN